MCKKETMLQSCCVKMDNGRARHIVAATIYLEIKVNLKNQNFVYEGFREIILPEYHCPLLG